MFRREKLNNKIYIAKIKINLYNIKLLEGLVMNYLEIYEKLMSLSEEEIKFKIGNLKNLINTKSELSIEYLKFLYLYLGTT